MNESHDKLRPERRSERLARLSSRVLQDDLPEEIRRDPIFKRLVDRASFSPPMRILIVADEEDVVAFWREFLSPLFGGWHVDVSGTVPEQPGWDLVVVHVAFNRGAYQEAIASAHARISDKGVVVAVAPAGNLRSPSRLNLDFLRLVAKHGQSLYYDPPRIPRMGFGVVEQGVVILQAGRKTDYDKPMNGWTSGHAWVLAMHVDQEKDLYERACGVRSPRGLRKVLEDAAVRLLAGAIYVEVSDVTVRELERYFRGERDDSETGLTDSTVN